MKYITNEKGIDLAYEHDAGKNGAHIMFLPGFKSDMMGSKANFLAEKCAATSIGFTRFDYSAHGASAGDFAACTLSDWLADSALILEQIVQKPALLIGSSMGGWLGLRLCVTHPHLVTGFIGIAAAPDFTRDITARLSDDHRAQLAENGYFTEGHDYGDDPYIFTKALLDDGENHIMLDGPINYDGPVILHQGKEDSAVAWEKALQIQERLAGTQVKFIDDGDHSLSRPGDLDLLWQSIEEILRRV